MLKELQKCIAIKSIGYDKQANKECINLITTLLTQIGFDITIKGDSPSGQPAIIAKLESKQPSNKIVLYGHYDVERIKRHEKWISDPFELIEKNGRLYGRGIADNKGILLARILALKEMVANKQQLPSILWLIQGEEEVKGVTAFKLFKEQITLFNAKIYLEETGYYNKNQQLLFVQPKASQNTDFINQLLGSVFHNKAKIEYRHLNKFTSKCPLLSNIPEKSIYLGFGPNDENANIHRENESLNKNLLKQHTQQFKDFIIWLNQATLSTCVD